MMYRIYEYRGGKATPWMADECMDARGRQRQEQVVELELRREQQSDAGER